MRVIGHEDGVCACVFIGMCFGTADWSRAEQMGPHYQRGATEERIKPTVFAGYLLYHWLHHRLRVMKLRNFMIGAHFPIEKDQNFTFLLKIPWQLIF